MAKVKFTDIVVGQVYVTRGGIAVINKSGKTVNWGYDRVLVTGKNDTKLVVQTPWGTSCILKNNYPLFATHETEVRYEFKLVTTYISKQEIPFDVALHRGICTEIVSPKKIEINDPFLRKLIKYFATPQLIGSAAKKFGESYQKIRYLIGKVEKIEGYKVIQQNGANKRTVHIIEVNNG